MKQVDRTVIRETGYIAVWVLILSVLMQAVFLILKLWDITVLLGNLLGSAAAVGNFFLMGITVQAATSKEDEKQMRGLMKLSQSLRLVMLFAAAALGVLLSCFNSVTAIVPLFFPRLAIAFRPLFMKEK